MGSGYRFLCIVYMPAHTMRQTRRRKKHPIRGGDGEMRLLPGPFVGEPKTYAHPTENQNYYAMNSYDNDPQYMTVMRGGGCGCVGGRGKRPRRRTRKQSRRRRGGGAMQEFINLTRGLTYRGESALHTIQGEPEPVNPLVFKDQLRYEWSV